MFYKLSNTAPLRVIENEFNAKFEYERLYKPSSVINGLEESNLSIITMQEPSVVKIGIWGILPTDLEENWTLYQNFTNTLNINLEEFDIENSPYKEPLDQRRCIVITDGFFTSLMVDGKMQPYHIFLRNHKPFVIAGIYNELDDGFITCSILITRTPESFNKIPNMFSYIPVILSKRDRSKWLDKTLNYTNLKDLVYSDAPLKYFSQAISKEFYENNILFNMVPETNNFENYLKLS